MAKWESFQQLDTGSSYGKLLTDKGKKYNEFLDFVKKFNPNLEKVKTGEEANQIAKDYWKSMRQPHFNRSTSGAILKKLLIDGVTARAMDFDIKCIKIDWDKKEATIQVGKTSDKFKIDRRSSLLYIIKYNTKEWKTFIENVKALRKKPLTTDDGILLGTVPGEKGKK